MIERVAHILIIIAAVLCIGWMAVEFWNSPTIEVYDVGSK
jgi:hypothetical protein